MSGCDRPQQEGKEMVMKVQGGIQQVDCAPQRGWNLKAGEN